jgi:hypothetical protein
LADPPPHVAMTVIGSSTWPPVMSRSFDIWFPIASMPVYTKFENIIWTTGRYPAAARPTAMPVRLVSLIGVLRMRSGPNRS